ncbi:MAG: response regulator [Desulfobulbaceae bacterium]|nr:response regulator [Desulfobulbaceae bacterium]
MPESTKQEQTPGLVLVVDDEERNRRLLADLLSHHHYTIIEAVDGEDGLNQATAHLPDVILLDVMMPKMDGYEVCRRLQSAEKTMTIPVLMVTALHGRQDKLAGIKAGATDFLSKPIDLDEVLLRVGNAVKSKRLYDDISRQHKRLQELENLRDNLMHMLVHDLKNPLGNIRGCLDLLKMQLPEVKPNIQKIMTLSRASTQAMLIMINSLLDLSRLEAGEMQLETEEADINKLVAQGGENMAGLIAESKITLTIHQTQPLSVPCDAVLIGRVIINLLANAIKFSPIGGEITITTSATDHGIKVAISDQGQGIPAEYHQMIFDKFAQVKDKNSKYGTGLGLTFCKMAIEAHHGTIGVESRVGQGSTFWFTLPQS